MRSFPLLAAPRGVQRRTRNAVVSLAAVVASPLLGLSACASTPAPVAKPESAETAAEGSSHHEKHAELSATDVVQRLRGNETDLRRCFFTNPSLRGAARFRWQMDADGKVQAVKRETSTLGDPQVEACIGQRLGEIHFADLSQPSTARWTFVFRLVDPPAPTSKAKHGAAKPKKKNASGDERGLSIDSDSAGKLAEDAIDNVVEAGYPLFARCYRDGVSRNHDLGGLLKLHFVVSPSGSVSEVSDAGSDLSDRQVVDCVAEGFYALRFPAPEHGSVGVVYRIRFDSTG